MNRSKGLLLRLCRQCAVGKAMCESVSSTPSCTIFAAFGSLTASKFFATLSPGELKRFFRRVGDGGGFGRALP
jgi:hypothetical protein